jgi:hypothetical protein
MINGTRIVEKKISKDGTPGIKINRMPGTGARVDTKK